MSTATPESIVLYTILVFAGMIIVMQLKHFLADFILQNEYMLGKFKEKGWVLPLLAHASVQALFTFGISMIFTNLDIKFSVIVSILDLITHFSMDRIKASPYMLGVYKYPDKKYFTIIGVDQLVHHCVDTIIAAAIMYKFIVAQIMINWS